MKAFPESTTGCTSHVVTSEGEASRRRHVVTFQYDDGTRSFDGVAWTCVPAAPKSGLFSAVTGKPVQRATRNVFGSRK